MDSIIPFVCMWLYNGILYYLFIREIEPERVWTLVHQAQCKTGIRYWKQKNWLKVFSVEGDKPSQCPLLLISNNAGCQVYMRLAWKKSNHCKCSENGFRDINVTWQPRRVDWNAHVWTITRSLYYSVGAIVATEWACVICGRHIRKDWASRAMNLQQILH